MPRGCRLGRHLEPKVQVGHVRLSLGSVYERQSRRLDVPQPIYANSIGSENVWPSHEHCRDKLENPTRTSDLNNQALLGFSARSCYLNTPTYQQDMNHQPTTHQSSHVLRKRVTLRSKLRNTHIVFETSKDSDCIRNFAGDRLTRHRLWNECLRFYA
jgi:hypothetical protein